MKYFFFLYYKRILIEINKKKYQVIDFVPKLRNNDINHYKVCLPKCKHVECSIIYRDH